MTENTELPPCLVMKNSGCRYLSHHVVILCDICVCNMIRAGNKNLAARCSFCRSDLQLYWREAHPEFWCYNYHIYSHRPESDVLPPRLLPECPFPTDDCICKTRMCTVCLFVNYDQKKPKWCKSYHATIVVLLDLLSKGIHPDISEFPLHVQ
jgi:hypothetical protein